MSVYYNEIEPYAAQWLRNLIAVGYLPPGEVDERDVRTVQPDDVREFTQCHFFAGIGGWPLALRLAGWSDDRAVWTGSCPCQPFSTAGRRGGVADERHLWPVWFRLVAECRPPVVFGEQVASPDGLAWLDAVHADLEGAGYAVGAADLCAAGVGAPHIRQRLYFVGVADADRTGLAGRQIDGGERGHRGSAAERGGGRRDGMADGTSGGRSEGSLPCGGTGYGAGPADGGRLVDAASGGAPAAQQPGRRSRALGAGAGGGRLGDADREHAGRVGGCARRAEAAGRGERRADGPVGDEPSAPGRGFWADAELVACRDGKSRPVGAGIQPLAHGVPARVGKLRAAGNAIVPQVAAAFIRSVMPWIDERRAA